MTEILDTIREHSGPLTVSRTTEETVTRGIVIPGTVSVAGIEGHMQPLSPRELLLMPEGSRTQEWWHIWALQELLEDDFVTDGTAVVVRVVKREFWKEAPFWHVQGVKTNVDLSRIFLLTGIGAPIFPDFTSAAVGDIS